MKRILLFALFSLCASAGAAGAYAQSAVSGAVSGTVSDPSHAVVPSASVTLLNASTNQEELAATDADGRFRFNSVQPGTYTLTIKTGGFADYKQEQVVVEVGRTSIIDATLSVGGAQAEVSVVADLPVVNT